MTTMMSRLIPLTDATGKLLVPGDEFEPTRGSIVLTNGQWGTAWQRFFDDGLWHSVGQGREGVTWEHMLQCRNLVLVYEAAERGEQ